MFMPAMKSSLCVGLAGLALLALPAVAQPPAPALPAAPESRGEMLYSVHCSACHATEVHWRDKKQAADWSQLKAEVERWKDNAKLDWSAADVLAVTRYLNAMFYHYPPLVVLDAENGAQAKPAAKDPRPVRLTPYITGGVGVEEMAGIRAAAKDYNLKLMFAQKGAGNYVADVRVLIENSKNEKFIDADSTGPWLLANLPAGRYRVTVEMNGQRFTRNFVIGKKGQASLQFYF